MYIKKLKLKNYRNYNEIEINFDKNINIIYGNNAEGKTNLLESIYMCSTSKSHKNSKENEIINFKETESHIKLFLYKESNKDITIDIQLNKDKKKGIAVNKVKIEKLSEFLGLFNVIMFAPEDLNIIKDGPQVRRKFIDIEICQIDKIYTVSLNNYNKTLNERNILLKDINNSNVNKKDLIDILDVYDEKIVEYGIQLILKRKENIKKLAELIKDIHYKISDEKEYLIIDYENDIINSIVPNENVDINSELKTNYLKKLKETREIDIKNQYTGIGPHRDDISFKIGEKDIRRFGSQGQKKTAAISLKLSELRIIKEKTNETPVLLLDDVFSELDESRQKLLVSNLKDVQTIITCTGIKKNIFDLLNPDKIFQVKNNMVIEKIK
ncbi:MAG: DNA replication/repair protein RecF [Lachnospiraceae bacterium]|nr:DNA replication/repair protein RecF [Lachnospiraceae bacterium]